MCTSRLHPDSEKSAERSRARLCCPTESGSGKPVRRLPVDPRKAPTEFCHECLSFRRDRVVLDDHSTRMFKHCLNEGCREAASTKSWRNKDTEERRWRATV